KDLGQALADGGAAPVLVDALAGPVRDGDDADADLLRVHGGTALAVVCSPVRVYYNSDEPPPVSPGSQSCPKRTARRSRSTPPASSCSAATPWRRLATSSPGCAAGGCSSSPTRCWCAPVCSTRCAARSPRRGCRQASSTAASRSRR